MTMEPGTTMTPITPATQARAPEEALLLEALRRHEARAYEQVMRRYNRLLFRAARGIVRDDAEAQDAVQETWLRVFTKLDSFRGESALGTWLTRIVINQALGRQRRLGRTVAWTDAQEPEDPDMPAPPHDPHLAPATPEQEAARAQLRRKLEAAIDLLAPIYRSVFVLRAVEGLSVEAAAESLEVSPDVVKTRYLRARALLRTHFADDPEPLANGLHDFDGRRCDELVAAVLARLRSAGVLRDH
jgi:RNA polymerase sigma-70 factor (ECF subfamily)